MKKKTVFNLSSELEWPTFWLEAASTLFFAITAWILIKDFFGQQHEIKLQVTQMKDDAYGRLRDHHHDLIRLQIEDTDLLKIFSDTKSSNKELNRMPSGNEWKIFNFYLAEFDLYERVRSLVDDPTLEAIDEVEWLTWLIYLEKISHHWIFEYTYEETEDIFSEKMMAQIKNDIIKKQPFAKKHLLSLLADTEKQSEIDEEKLEEKLKDMKKQKKILSKKKLDEELKNLRITKIEEEREKLDEELKNLRRTRLEELKDLMKRKLEELKIKH